MDSYRPRCHFRPENNWMNDPNGPIWYNGEYHLFYQYNPNGDYWGTIHWGHAVSKDLVHWEEKGMALSPDNESGEIHCYSGCAFINDGNTVSDYGAVNGNVPVIYYTSVGEGSRGPESGALQRCARSYDHMQSWVKDKEDVLAIKIHEGRIGSFYIAMWRDPFVWRENDGYYMLLGGTKLPEGADAKNDLKKGKGCLLLYFSEDATQWGFKSILMESEEFWLLECPNMIPFGKEYLLLYSPMEAVRYHVGTLDKKKGVFQTKTEGIFDYSILKKGFYAPNTYLNDPKQRKIVVGWLSEADRSTQIKAEGWAGMLSLPREVWVNNGRLFIKPAEEVEMLRKKMIYEKIGSMEEGEVMATGKALEIAIGFTPFGSEAEFDLRLLSNQNEREYTSLIYKNHKISIVRDHSTLVQGCGEELIEAELPLPNPSAVQRINLRIFIDHSALEVYVNDRITMSARVYPCLHGSDEVVVKKCSNLNSVESRVWELSL